LYRKERSYQKHTEGELHPNQVFLSAPFTESTLTPSSPAAKERQEKKSKAGGVLVTGTHLIALYRPTIEFTKQRKILQLFYFSLTEVYPD
jgi:hypothetical protein